MGFLFELELELDDWVLSLGFEIFFDGLELFLVFNVVVSEDRLMGGGFVLLLLLVVMVIGGGGGLEVGRLMVVFWFFINFLFICFGGVEDGFLLINFGLSLFCSLEIENLGFFFFFGFFIGIL